MKIAGKCLTWFLSFAMIFTIVPITFAGSNENILNEPKECVMYNLLDRPIYVSNDVEMAQDAPEQYKLFDENGNYKIQLEDNAFFPYEVLFSYQESPDDEWKETREWFDTPDSTVEVAGHIFSVYSEMNDSDKISQFGVYVGDEYVAARPAEKEFSDSGLQVTSLIPHEKETLTGEMSVDLSGFLRTQLYNVSAKTVFSGIYEEGKTIAVSDTESIFEIENNEVVKEVMFSTDRYIIVDADEYTLDLFDVNSYNVNFNLIVGNCKQLDAKNNNYYSVNIILPEFMEDIMEFDVYSQKNGERSKVSKVYSGYSFGDTICMSLDIYLEQDSLEDIDEYIYMCGKFTGDYAQINQKISVYRGCYTKVGELEQSNIIENVWDVEDCAALNVGCKINKGVQGHADLITISDNENFILPISINCQTACSGVVCAYLHGSNYSGYETVKVAEHIQSYEIVLEDINFEVFKEFDVNSEYNLILGYRDCDCGFGYNYIENFGIDLVKKAVIGFYDNISQTDGLTDIKEQLFSEEGYKANYSGDGVKFTIIDNNDNIHKLSVKASASEKSFWDYYIEDSDNELVEKAKSDFQFNITGFIDSDDNEVQGYVIPSEHDSYYSKGFQTVLTINEDVANIKPIFNTKNIKNVYASVSNGNNVVSVPQYSGREASYSLDFSDNAIEYSVVNNDNSVKNYWVSFVPKYTGGSKLFVNAVNGAAVEYDDNGNKVINREIFFNNENFILNILNKYGASYGYYNVLNSYHTSLYEYIDCHDIFVANIGDEELTGLSVTLEDAKNIKIDDYWTVGGENNDTLAAFTTVEKAADKEGELANTAKIRLVLDEDNLDGTGIISGKLTISADGQEPVIVNLTGLVGTPYMNIDALADAVKYVPYSAFLQTNIIDSNVTASFSIVDGKLPKGISLNENGEIYGVPTEEGEFSFTVQADYKYKSKLADNAESISTEKRTFEIKVLENTDENVNAQTDSGYAIQIAIPSEIVDYDTDYIFKVEGVIDEFENFWLDGKCLLRNVDYTAESGSTKITVMKQTFKNAGTGKHTIAAEFRTTNNELKRSVQNYTSKVSSANTGNSNNGNNTGGSNSGSGSGGGFAAPMSYGIEKNNTVNGTFKVNPENAAAGKTVTITSVPNKGYETSLVTVKDAKGNIIQTVKGSNGTYTFVMPSSKVTVSVEFKLSNPSDLYDDVSTSDWFYPEVKWATESEYMNGVGNNLFKPNGQISEAVLVQVLARMAGVDTSKYSNENYSDIESGKWYSDAAKWAKAVEILGADGFSAQPPCSRGKLAVMLVKYFDAQGIKYLETGNGVIIADESDMSLDEARAFRILVEAGIFKGKGNNVMDPDGATTRAELAALMHRVSDYIFLINEYM